MLAAVHCGVVNVGQFSCTLFSAVLHSCSCTFSTLLCCAVIVVLYLVLRWLFLLAGVVNVGQCSCTLSSAVLCFSCWPELLT